MCRKVVFKGSCPECTTIFIWEELSQELSCLEAKNNGLFGMCEEGTIIDEKPHDQECDSCLAELEADEGYHGGTEDAFENAKLDAAGRWHGDTKDAADRAPVSQESEKHRNKKRRTT